MRGVVPFGANEAEGYVPDPKNGFGLNIDYANTTFGQGMNITQLQMFL